MGWCWAALWSASASAAAFGLRIPRLESWLSAQPPKRALTGIAASTVGCNGDPHAVPRVARGPVLDDAWNADCELHVTRLGALMFKAGNLVELQQDPSAFHFEAGVPVPDRVWVPGLLIGPRTRGLSLGLGTLASPHLWAEAALTLRF